MLKENIKAIRKSKGLSQDELAEKLKVVRQTVSKWERGLSVPDAEMLIAIAKVFETPVHVLLGENIFASRRDDLKVLSEKLEEINLQLAQKEATKRKSIQKLLALLSFSLVFVFIAMFIVKSPYLFWDYSDPELAVVGTLFHGFEWIFVRVAPLALVGLIGVIGILKRKSSEHSVTSIEWHI